MYQLFINIYTMETDELPVLDPNLDYFQVPPIHQKRTIAFINHFIMRTVSFLNKFAETCESRLMEFEYKLQNVEASLLILESQLASVPWLDDNIEQLNVPKAENDENIKSLDLPDVETESSNVENETSGVKASDDPRYATFFKMIQFGVPIQAVKLKMDTEGLDPSILDNPNIVLPSDPHSPQN